MLLSLSTGKKTKQTKPASFQLASQAVLQESDKFVGIDMDVKEILMNGFQIKSAKEFCNQGRSLCFGSSGGMALLFEK